MFVTFIIVSISNNILVGFPTDAAQDTWISVLICGLMWILPIAMFCRMIKIMPEKNIYQMSEFAFGKVFGRAISIICTFYALLSLVVTTYGYTSFVNINTLRYTPFLIIMAMYIIPIIFISKKGLHLTAKWAMILVVLWLFISIFYSIIAIPKANLNNLLPIFDHEFKVIGSSAIKLAAIPTGEIVLTLYIADKFEKKANVKKVYYLTLVSCIAYMLLTFIRTCALIGAETATSVIFSNERALMVVKISDFFERIESIVGVIYILAGIIKGAFVMRALSNGIASLFSVKQPKDMIVPSALFVLAISCTAFTGFTQLFDFIKIIYPKFGWFFQLFIPFIIWIPAEIKLAIQKKKAGTQNTVKQE